MRWQPNPEDRGPWSTVGGVILTAGIAIAVAWLVVVGVVVVLVGGYVMVAPLARWWPWIVRVPKGPAAGRSAGSGLTVKGHKIDGNRHEGWYTTTGSGVHLVTEIGEVAFSKVCLRSETKDHSDRAFYEVCVRPDDLPREVILGRRGLRRRGRIVVRDITDAGILVEERDTGQQKIRLTGYLLDFGRPPDEGGNTPTEVITSDERNASTPEPWTPPVSPTRPGDGLLKATGQHPDDLRRRALAIERGVTLVQAITTAQLHYAGMPITMAADQAVAELTAHIEDWVGESGGGYVVPVPGKGWRTDLARLKLYAEKHLALLRQKAKQNTG
jgi:hypothetical protein